MALTVRAQAKPVVKAAKASKAAGRVAAAAAPAPAKQANVAVAVVAGIAAGFMAFGAVESAQADYGSYANTLVVPAECKKTCAMMPTSCISCVKEASK
eukprot:CAMPEP_0170141852 /NCGR_PEP_ID=MMETSP0033_2-20121228/7265_1 /TAXON_ID=195969 /ORGANISM="Dolichomastix tenuilepis, Strain CCMP3274" /LENGTH=97 /DNA_ID=CAMNT_0010378143 /DNA_START=89 /DNA_END=382 /DNA_ORIENTATION=+